MGRRICNVLFRGVAWQDPRVAESPDAKTDSIVSRRAVSVLTGDIGGIEEFGKLFVDRHDTNWYLFLSTNWCHVAEG